MERKVIKRGKGATCKTCGMSSLEWVQTQGGWVMVPAGTSDFSESVHALTQSGCIRRNGGTPAAAPASGDVTIVQYDDKALRADIERLNDDVRSATTALAKYEQRDGALAGTLEAIDGKIDSGLVAMRRDLDALTSARSLTIATPFTPKPVKLGRVHNQLANAVTMIAAIGGTGILMLKGEAGSMKSSAGPLIATAMGLRYNPFTCGPTMTDTDFMGYFDAKGNYIDTWRIWEHFRDDGDGGLTNFDEFDNNSASGVTTINNLTSNELVGFPIRLTTRHKQSYFMACGNTFGRGADEAYIGRSQLDGATLSRLVYLPWETDWAYVGDIMGLNVKGDHNTFPEPTAPRAVSEFKDWGQYVKRIHDKVDELGVMAIVSSRAIINGAKLLAAGVHTNYQSASDGLVESAVIWNHMSQQDAATVKAAL